MASSFFPALPLTIFLILLLPRASLQNHVSTENTGFSVELVHRDSIKSPLFNASHTTDDQIRAAIQRSISRIQFLQHTSSSYDSNIIGSQVEFLMTINVGTPSRSITAIADTGSDLVWTSCKPCDGCYKQDAPLFDPNSSSTYRDLNCSSDFCHAASLTRCENNQCHFDIRYGLHGSYSTASGTLAGETFTFDTSDGNKVDVPNIVFGCSHESKVSFEPNMAGIVGLGRSSISLVSQLGSSVGKKLSYCLVPYSTKNTSSKLSFGSNAVFTDPNAQSTNLVTGLSETYYTVSLSGITINDQEIKPSYNEIIIDSGSTLNFLRYETVDNIVALLEKAIPLQRVDDPDMPLCYSTSDVQRSNVVFPDIVYKLGTVTLTLGRSNSFIAIGEKVCLAMVGVGQNGENVLQILGNIAQQDFHVGFDLDSNAVYFAPSDCAKL